MSWPPYVDYSSTHAAGMNLVSTGCHFPTLPSRTSRASFETLSASLNTEMRLLATNPFLGCKRLLGISEGALTVLRSKDLTRKGWTIAPVGRTWKPFRGSYGCVVPIQVQGENSLSYFFHKYSPVFLSKVSNWPNRLHAKICSLKTGTFVGLVIKALKTDKDC